nr:hypothetical protein HK105_003350 [Polyrhizophydium stewartii]
MRSLRVSGNDLMLSRIFKEKGMAAEPKKLRKVVQLLIDDFQRLTPAELSDELAAKHPSVGQADLLMLARILRKHTDQGIPLAAALCQALMHCGNDEAAFIYANMIGKGFPGTPRNEELGARMIRELADRNHGQSLYLLALKALAAQRKTEAIRLMIRSAENGFSQAQQQMGVWLKSSDTIVLKNADLAVRYLQKAHEQGLVESTYLLATMYEKGRGTPGGKPDIKKVHELLVQAASKGLAVAQYDLGSYYFQGHADIPRNLDLAIEYWTMAAEGHFAFAQINLGNMYLNGFEIGGPGGGKVDKDWVRARELLEMAVKDGPNLSPELASDAQALLKELDRFEAEQPDEAARHRERAAKRKPPQGMCVVM